MRTKYSLILLFYLAVFPLQALSQSSEAFVVEVKDEFTKVLAPKSYNKEQNVIVKNETLVKLRGRLESSHSGVLTHVAIPPKEHESISVTVSRGEKLRFLPLAPSLQAVELKFGQSTYEIPPQE